MKWKIVFSLFFFVPCLSYAIEQTGPALGLTQGLSQLKNSVDQMAVANDSLAAKNVQLKNRLNSLQSTVQKLVQENTELNHAKSKLDLDNPVKAEQIEQLENRSNKLDQLGGQLEDQIKKTREALDAKIKEEQQINDQIKKMLNAPGATVAPAALPPELSEVKEQKRKEKLAMLKLISEIQAHRILLQEQILDFQKNTPTANAPTESGRKEALEKQIQELQEEVNRLNALTIQAAHQGWDEDQIHQMEASVSDLEKKRDELNSLITQMQAKNHQIHASQSPKNEEDKLQGGIEKLKSETKGLKMDLEEMQQQMVELDKRKSYLEAVLKNN
jgi:DNA repair exonuclease SbcCD ATPase subunit